MGSCTSTPVDGMDILKDNNEYSDDDELSATGYLKDRPPWFPFKNGHCDISKLFVKYEEIGHGVTSSVWRSKYKDKICAIKEIKKDDEFGKMLFMTEARSLSKLKHPAIIKYIDMLMDEKYYYLILELADFDLYHIMKEKGYLSEKKTKKIIYAILSGIAHIHRKNLVHRDLKPENIVFIANNTDQPKLIDFGDAELAKKEKIYNEFVGTPPYMSPERLKEHNGDQLKKADIWAIGVIAYEMYSGKRCFEGDTQKQVFEMILSGKWSWKLDRRPSDEMQDFVKQCLKMNYTKRICAKHALQHQWFADTTKKQQCKQINHGQIICNKKYVENKHDIKQYIISPIDEYDNIGNQPFQSIPANIQSVARLCNEIEEK